MNRALYSVIFATLLFTSTTHPLSLYAKKIEKEQIEAQADLYYQLQEFDKAAAEYLKLLADRKLEILTNDRISIKFAVNLYHIRQYEEAEKHFGAAMARNIAAFTPKYACAYVATLIRNNKFKQAAELVETFSRMPQYKSYQPLQNFIEGLKLEAQAAKVEGAGVSLASFNQPGSNSASVRYKDGIIFINNEDSYKSMIKEARFFYHDENGCKPYTKVPYTMQAGAACFTNGGKAMLYTDNRYRDGQMVAQKSDVITNLLRIVELSYNERTQKWEKPKDIFSKKNEYSICHPTVSEDGQRLYFSANFDGAERGMDIYMSKKTGGGWGRPVNLGIAVNTANDELHPNIHGNVLSFSSNGHKGFGEMDIYTVELDGEGMPISQTLTHLPYPINTIYNDYALMHDSAGDGFFTSDRPDNNMLDAIYSWTNDTRVIPKNPLMDKAVVVERSQALLRSEQHDAELRSAENMAIKLIEGSVKADATVFFEYNSHRLSNAAKKAINTFIDAQKGKYGSVVVLGYADIIGTEERNIELSTQRAESAKHYMVSKGYPESLISTVGKGKLGLSRSEQKKSDDLKERLAPARKAEIKNLE